MNYHAGMSCVNFTKLLPIRRSVFIATGIVQRASHLECSSSKRITLSQRKIMACQVKCVPCRKAGIDCQKEAITTVAARPFIPREEPDVLLQCGCWIPWPIITLLGSSNRQGGTGREVIEGRQVHCVTHGYRHRVTQAQIAKAKKKMKKELANAGQGSFDDIPPF